MARRLCVIILDDAILHPDYPLLVWCMGANDFEYTTELMESILQIVSDVASNEYRDVYATGTIEPYTLWQQALPIIKCLLIRAFYKGMHGDVKNLQAYAGIWNERFMSERWKIGIKELYSVMPVLDELDIRGKFGFSDATIEGIDCNCSGMLGEIVKNKRIMDELELCIKENLEEYLKRTIWQQRSGFNPRRFIWECGNFNGMISVGESQEFVRDLSFAKIVLTFADAYSRKQLFKKFSKQK